MTFNVTHTGSSGLAMRIGGYADAKGTINADFDLDYPPYANPPLISPGSTGLLYDYVSRTQYMIVPCIVKKVHYERAVDSQVKYSFDVEMASQYGNFAYPDGSNPLDD